VPVLVLHACRLPAASPAVTVTATASCCIDDAIKDVPAWLTRPWPRLVGCAGESASLQQYDQLAKGMQAHQVFLGFREGAITFDPTFKVHRRPGLLYMQQVREGWGCAWPGSVG